MGNDILRGCIALFVVLVMLVGGIICLALAFMIIFGS